MLREGQIELYSELRVRHPFFFCLDGVNVVDLCFFGDALQTGEVAVEEGSHEVGLVGGGGRQHGQRQGQAQQQQR